MDRTLIYGIVPFAHSLLLEPDFKSGTLLIIPYLETN